MKNKLKLFITCIFSVFAVSVAGISTFAWFQQTQAEAQTVQSGTVTSGSSDLTINGVTGYKYAYDDTGDGIDYSSGHVSAYAASGNANPNIAQDETSDSLDAPSQGVGFYVLGDDTWAAEYGNNKKARTYFSSVRFEDKYGNNWAALINYNFSANEEVKIVWYHYEVSNGQNNATETEITTLGTGADSYVTITSDYNIKFTAAGNYTIWIAGKAEATPNKTLYFTRNGNRTRSLNSQNKNNIRDSINRSTSNTKVFWYQNNYNMTSLRIYYGGGSTEASWDDRPYLNSAGFNWGGHSIYYYLIPSDTTKVKITGYDNSTYREFGDYTGINNESNCVYWNNNSNNLGKTENIINPEVLGTGSGLTRTQGSGLAMTPSSSFPDDSYLQYEVSLNATANTQFKIHNITYNFFSSDGYYSDLESGVDSTLFTQTDSASNITITRSCTVKLFLKFKTNGSVKIWAENPVYYTLHVMGKNFNVSSQTHGNAQELVSFNVQKTNTTLISPTSNDDITTTTFPNKNSYNAPNTFKWYTNSNLQEANAYNGTDYSSDSSNRLNLYCGLYLEKTVTITYKLSLWKGSTTELDGSYRSSYDTSNLNITGITGLSVPNQMTWGITGSFDVDDYVTTPTYGTSNSTYPHFTQYSNGWSASDKESTSAAYASGTTITANTILTYYLQETKYTIILNYRYFDTNGNAYTHANLPATMSGTYYGFNSWSAGADGVPLGTVKDVGLTINVASRNDGNYNGVFSKYLAFRHNITNGKLFTDEECETPFNGHITASGTNLYLKMVMQPSIQLYVRKPDDNGTNDSGNHVYYWHSIKAHFWNDANATDGSQICTSTDESVNSRKYVVADYIKTPKNDEYYTFEAPFGYKLTLIGYDQFDNQFTDNDTHASGACTIDLYTKVNNVQGNTYDWNSDSLKKKLRGDNNVIQLWNNVDNMVSDNGHKCRWNWGGKVTNKYYIVGENLTDDAAGSSTWDIEHGLEMHDGGVGTDFPDAKCYLSKVVLTSAVKFKIYNDLGGQWYGGDKLASGDSQIYAQDTDGGNHNIILKSGIAGKFNIYLDNDYKIHLEDAETGGYMYFTGPTGLEQSDTFQMGYGGKELGYSGDNNILIYDQDIQVEKGDQFAIRNRFKGTYQWFDFSNVNASSKVSNVEQGSTEILGEAVYSGGSLQANSTKSVTTIKFKKSGSFRIFVYEDNSNYYISIIDSPSLGNGYYIIPAESSTANTEEAGFSNNIKMRTIGSGTNKNIAMYTGLRVTPADISSGKKYCFKSQDRQFVTADGVRKKQNVAKTYSYFYDNISQSETGLNQTPSTSERTFNLAEANAFITFKNPGYYDIYLYNSGGQTYVSFAQSKVGKQGTNFFTLNSIPKDRQDKQGIKAAQTTLVIRVDFTVTAKTSTTVNADLEFFDSTGLGNYLKYYAVFDIQDFEGLDPYKYMRAHYYDESGFTNKTASGSLASTTISANDSNTHSCYIMIDYSENTIADLLTGSYLNNFMFVMRSTQG